MHKSDPLTFLQTLLTKDYEVEKYAAGRKKPQEREPLVITLSRDFGALGEEIAKRLAECLGIPLYDQEILDLVAKHAKTDKFHYQRHDEQVNASVTTFLYSLVSGTTATLENYRRYLYDVVLQLARNDCVIVGRGAHLILSDRRVFRVRVVGSRQVCAERIAAEQGVSLAEAQNKVLDINVMRHKSIASLFSDHFEHCSLEHATNFDLVINTDHIPAEGAMPVILLALQQAGYNIQSHGQKA